VDDLSTAVECGVVEVPVDYGKPSGARIDIGFVRLAAFNPSSGRNPLFFLAGGPGQSATGIASQVNDMLSAVRSDRDIVLIDQRGTGRSAALECDEDGVADFASDYDLIDLEILSRCAAGLPEGIEHFTTANAIRDFEAVRDYLGYAQVDLLGGSYGSRAAIAYLSIAGDSVGSVILDGISPPAVPIGLFGDSAADAFERILERCKAIDECRTAFPSLREDFDALMAKLAQGPVEATLLHPTTGDPMPVKLWQAQLVSLLRLTLYSPDSAALTPLLITEAANDNYRPLIALAMGANAGGGINLLLNLTIICNEDFPRFTRSAIAEDSDNDFGGDTSFRLWDTACPEMPRFTPELDWMQAGDFTQPALLLSGARDPVTPPSNGEVALELFQNARHVVVDEAAHIVSGSDCGGELVASFLENPDPNQLDTDCINDIPRQRFRIDRMGSLSTTGAVANDKQEARP
jgi:pimeloyl-ACP methyl ester carboxylesterase